VTFAVTLTLTMTPMVAGRQQCYVAEFVEVGQLVMIHVKKCVVGVAMSSADGL
jgi:hypothetical protein